MAGRSSGDAEARRIGATVMWVRVAATQRVRGAVGRKRGNTEARQGFGGELGLDAS
jgi:hypothetical protein